LARKKRHKPHPGTKIWRKAQFYRILAALNAYRPQKFQLAKADIYGPEAVSVVSAGTLCRIHWLTVSPESCGDRPGIKIRPGHLPHENRNKYVEMPALHPPFEIGAVFC
jgi:hypothetical protein